MNDGAPTPAVPRKRTKFKRDIFRIVLMTSFFAFAAWALKHEGVRENIFDITHIRESLGSVGWIAQLTFIGVSALAMGVGMPRLWVSAVSGSLFGAFMGTIISLVASLLGASLNFLMGRSLLRGPVQRRMPERLRKWYDRFGEKGFRWILYARLFPLSNATVVNLLCGASRVRYRDFLAATVIGYLPFTLVFALFGSSAAKQAPLQLVLGSVLFAMMLGGRMIWRRIVPAGELSESEEEGEDLEESPEELAPGTHSPADGGEPGS